jgi:hypothetical protein
VKYGLKKPCKSCPFVIAVEFHLRPERIEEIRDCRAEFSCHNTVDYDAIEDDVEYQDFEDEDGAWGQADAARSTVGESHCYGHLVLTWSEWNGFDQLQAMAARAGMFDPKELPTPDEAGVFETWADMIQANEER